MDFFGHQDKARRASKGLVWLFTAAVASIIFLIYIAAKILLVTTKSGDGDLMDWPVLGVVAAAVIVLVGGAMLFKTAQLRSGGGKVARMLGGRLVEINTKDPKERILRNIVEEMAIASGMPVPDIFVLDDEKGINAFAAGWSPRDAAIAVTRGSLDAFSRDELQGVIAHEFSHVFHGDMRLNIRLMGTLFGIIFIAVIGRILTRAAFYGGATRRRSNNKNSGGAIILFGLALVIIGYVGVFFARMIQAAVSRQREYLADASAVQYTRNPRGIGMALAKIGGIGGKIENAHAEEASHMMFANGVSRLGGALATHPPLPQRIERILPGFLKHNVSGDSMESAVAETPVPAEFAGGAVSGLAGTTTPEKLLSSVGDPQPLHVAAAHELLQEIPLDLSVATHEPSRAPSIAFALLLDDDEVLRKKQLDLLKDPPSERSNEVVSYTADYYRAITALDRKFRLPLLELVMPALRHLTQAERSQVCEHARALALADDNISPLEFALIKSLERHLCEGNGIAAKPRGRARSLKSCAKQASLVISVIAHAGANEDIAKAESAFERGKQALALQGVKLAPAAQAQPHHLDDAIRDLGQVSPLGKRQLITACAAVAADDGLLAPDEIDLIRALGELWDCPMPLTVSD